MHAESEVSHLAPERDRARCGGGVERQHTTGRLVTPNDPEIGSAVQLRREAVGLFLSPLRCPQIAEQRGRVELLDHVAVRGKTVLDISGKVGGGHLLRVLIEHVQKSHRVGWRSCHAHGHTPRTA